MKQVKSLEKLTSFKGQGKWLNANKLYDEQINIYQFAIKKLQKKIFLTLAKKYGVLTGQLAIYVIIDGQKVKNNKLITTGGCYENKINNKKIKIDKLTEDCFQDSYPSYISIKYSINYCK